MAPTPEETILEILRDADGNLYCLAVEGSKVVYQTEVLPNSQKLLIHQTDKTSPIIAAADLTGAYGGICVIEMHNPEAAVRLEHVHHKFPLSHANTYFSFGDKQYHWKAHSALVEDDTRVCLGVNHTANIGGSRRKLGSLILTHEGMKAKDMVVVTCLVEHARSDEAKLEKLEHNKHEG